MTKDPTRDLTPGGTAPAVELDAAPAARGVAHHDTAFFGHPRGLSTLFFTEMWERFSYYGMRALLVLFMTAAVAEGGLGFDVAKAGAIYAMYTSLVYLVSLPGGWVADRILGQRRSVLYGGIVIAAGHFAMAIPQLITFYLGLGLIVVGTGLLKPNISVMVGQLYAPADARRDAGFSIFYMGINIGAFVAPLVCGFLGETVDWHLGFAAAGIGMTFGLLQYVFGGAYLGTAGARPSTTAAEQAEARRLLLKAVLGVGAVIGTLAVLALTGAVQLTEERISNGYGVLLFLTVITLFGWLFTRSYWTPAERRQLHVVGVLFVAAAVFWSFFEQAGSSLNLFAAELTDRSVPRWVPFLGGEFPASWFQSLNPLFIIALAPLYAWLWVWLAKRGREPSSPGKFVFGLIFLGTGFAILVGGAALAQQGVEVSPNWLVLTYLFHTIGELTLSPVGLSAMTRLAPVRVVSLMMGVWFLASSVGNFMGGFLVRFYATMDLPVLFGTMAAFAIAMGLLLAVLVRPIGRMLAGERH
jgi:proton-dependent oligopeptide transporter, POT family